MAMQDPPSGFGSSAEFQVSALPWVMSSIIPSAGLLRYDLPNVSKYVIVSNLDPFTGSTGTIALAYTRLGAENNNKFKVLPRQSQTFDMRVKTLFISGTVNTEFSLQAGLNLIHARSMPTLTGSIAGVATWEGVG